jgi:hypothetical protein
LEFRKKLCTKYNELKFKKSFKLRESQKLKPKDKMKFSKKIKKKHGYSAKISTALSDSWRKRKKIKMFQIIKKKYVV